MCKGPLIAGKSQLNLATLKVHTHTLPVLGKDVPRSIAVCEAQ